MLGLWTEPRGPLPLPSQSSGWAVTASAVQACLKLQAPNTSGPHLPKDPHCHPAWTWPRATLQGCPSPTRLGILEMRGVHHGGPSSALAYVQHPLVGSATQAFGTVSLMPGKCTKAPEAEPLCTTTGKQLREFLHPENSLFFTPLILWAERNVLRFVKIISAFCNSVTHWTQGHGWL